MSVERAAVLLRAKVTLSWLLARNDIGERLIASPAISNGQIFLRSDDRLFAIGKR